jgi:hypothetical protein
MGVRQRGASTAKISRPRHAARRPPVSDGALGCGLSAAGPAAPGAWSTRLAPPLTPLTASHAPSHAASLPC